MAHPDHDSTRARRYLLGEASDREAAALELEYFGDEIVGDAIGAAEEELIEDYLSGRLGPDEASRFERVYLASPQHRTRVDVMRRLMPGVSKPVARVIRMEAAPTSPARVAQRKTLPWVFLAAAAAALAIGAAWMLRQPPDGRGAVVQNSPPAVPAPAPEVPSKPADDKTAPSLRVLALSISPISVRSAAASSALVIPPGTDIIALGLEGEAAGPATAGVRAVVRTVGGDEIWRGPANVIGLSPGVVARAEIPAALLRPEDYIVELFGTSASGVERERYRYFLRVRSR